MRKESSILWIILLLIILGASLGWSHLGIGPNTLNDSPLQKKLSPDHAAQAELSVIKSHSSLKPGPKILPSQSHPFHFVAFGDWGAGTPFQKAVARQLAEQYLQNPFQAVLLLGDNIYEVGDVRKHGKAYFTDMYTQLIQGGVHFIVALGNHDTLGGHQDEQVSFFKMPGYYYQRQEGSTEFFVLNTNTFNHDKVQQQWLKKALGQSKATWKIVMGHHPIYSSGEHGYNGGLQKKLEPILIQERADFYLAGHDHDYERFKPIQGVQHIVSGGGGAYLRDFEKPMKDSLIRIKKHHFLSFEQNANRLSLSVYDSDGNLIDQARWIKPSLQENERKTPQVMEHSQRKATLP